jgi:hypothetical protein
MIYVKESSFKLTITNDYRIQNYEFKTVVKVKYNYLESGSHVKEKEVYLRDSAVTNNLIVATKKFLINSILNRNIHLIS